MSWLRLRLGLVAPLRARTVGRERGRGTEGDSGPTAEGGPGSSDLYADAGGKTCPGPRNRGRGPEASQGTAGRATTVAVVKDGTPPGAEDGRLFR